MTEKDDNAGLMEGIWYLNVRRVVLAAAIDMVSTRLTVCEDQASILHRMANQLDQLLTPGARKGTPSLESLPAPSTELAGQSAPAVPPPPLELADVAVEDVLMRERVRLAHKVHDGLTQELTSLVLELEAIQRLAAREPQGLSERLRQATRSARTCLAEVRHLLAELQSKPPGPTRLVLSIQRLVDEFRHEEGLTVSLKSSGPDPVVSREVEQGIVGVIKEALTNARKHSRAGVLVVNLHSTADVIDVMVFDDGQGFDFRKAEEAARRGVSFGLVSMRQRIAALGGTFEVDSRRGKGTRVYLRVPLSGQVVSV